MAGPEAILYGLPVVGFDAGGIKEWLIDGENGFLVPWMDTHSLASRIEDLLVYKRLAREMGQAGRERVNRVYSTSRQVDSLERLFINVASKFPAVPATISSNDASPQFTPDFRASLAENRAEVLTLSSTANF
jgi:hypothetical protein